MLYSFSEPSKWMPADGRRDRAGTIRIEPEKLTNVYPYIPIEYELIEPLSC